MARNYDEVVSTGDEDDVRGAGYRPKPYWSLKNVGDSSVLRFLAETPEWVKGLTHQFVPVTLPQPEGHEGKWPGFMSATCRKDENLARFYPEGCPICADPTKDKWGKTYADKVQPLRYALAVEREIVALDNGTKVVQDKTVKIPARWGADGKPVEGETVEAPSIVIVAETMWRLFGQFKTMAADYGSMRGLDFTVKRIPDPAKPERSLLQVLPVVIPSQVTQEQWDMYANAVSCWLPNGGLRLKQLVGEQSEEEYYDRFWTRNGVMVPKGSGGGSSNGAPASVQAPVQSADPDKLAAMRARIANQAAPTA